MLGTLPMKELQQFQNTFVYQHFQRSSVWVVIIRLVFLQRREKRPIQARSSQAASTDDAEVEQIQLIKKTFCLIVVSPPKFVCFKFESEYNNIVSASRSSLTSAVSNRFSFEISSLHISLHFVLKNSFKMVTTLFPNKFSHLAHAQKVQLICNWLL